MSKEVTVIERKKYYFIVAYDGITGRFEYYAGSFDLAYGALQEAMNEREIVDCEIVEAGEVY